MKTALIPPTCLLGDYGTSYHLCLAHILKEDKRQMEYYQRVAASMDYVILDNGAYELGGSVPFQLVIDVALQICPDEIVLPDVLLDQNKTCKKATEGWMLLNAVYGDHKPNIMAVPQGKTVQQWISCLEYMIEHFEPHCIGLPVAYERLMGRGMLLKHIANTYYSLEYQPEVHLLGWDGDLYKLSRYAKDFMYILRGVDSAKPFYYAGRGNPRLLDNSSPGKRPTSYFKMYKDQFDTFTLESNIALFNAAAKGLY